MAAMLKKSLICLFISSFVFLQALSQKIIVNGKKSNGKLIWADFTGKKDNSSPFHANTGYLLNYKVGGITVIKDSVNIKSFEVTLELDPNKSWVKNKFATDELLVHEQGHFNLSIMCMLEILQKYKESKYKKHNFNDILRKNFEITTEKYKSLNQKYDQETNHSINKTEQEKWNAFFEKNVVLK